MESVSEGEEGMSEGWRVPWVRREAVRASNSSWAVDIVCTVERGRCGGMGLVRLEPKEAGVG